MKATQQEIAPLAAEFATAQDADGSWPVLMSIRFSIGTFAVPSAKGRTSATVSTYDGFHAFRHANAALMDRFSIPMKVRQQRLGHSDPGITLGIYTHVVGEDSRAAAEQLGRVVWAEFRPLTASN
jgi:hypothetical protein